MLSLKKILYAITKILQQNFKEDIYIEDNNTGGFDKSCLFVQLIPVSTEASTRRTNLRRLLISIKYFQEPSENIYKLHDVSDKLERIFGRTIRIDKRIFTINEMENTIINDDIGRVLDFIVHIEFHDAEYAEYTGPENLPEMDDIVIEDETVKLTREEYELMKKLYADLEGKQIYTEYEEGDED